MDLLLKAETVSVSKTYGNYLQTVDVELSGVDEDFIQQISKEVSLDVLLAGKTEAEIRSWVVNEYDWVQNLLNDFWQRSSDACPLDANEAEAQELEFIKYVNSL